MLSCGVCPSVCLSVCLSVTFVDHVKTNKHIFKIFAPSGSPTILVFPYQTGWGYSDGKPPSGGVECRWGRQKTRFWTNIWHSGFAAYRSTVLSIVRVANCEKQSRDGRQRASSTPRRPSSVVRTRRRRSVCDRLDVIRRRGGQTSPGHNTFGHNPRFLLPQVIVGQNPAGIFVEN